MSYNIDSVDTQVLEAKIRRTDLDKLVKKYAGDDVEEPIAECNFLDYHADKVPDSDGYVALESLEWYGEWSGNSHDILLKKILPKVMGKVEAIFYWEGGDSVSGVIVHDGKVCECDVEMRLVPIKKGRR